MLSVAFVLLSLAVLLGASLALLYLRQEAGRAPWFGRAAHGLFGAGGLALMLLAPFGAGGGLARAGLALIGAALPLGLIFWLGWNRLGRARDLVLILHAFLAITGFVLLSSWYMNR